jgi:hypothetical protein
MLCWTQGGIIGGGHRDLIQTAAGQAKLWVDLSGKEKTAAELLGYDQVRQQQTTSNIVRRMSALWNPWCV